MLDAAERLYRDHGVGFTMDQLEVAAGASRATIYRRIGGKADLLDALAERRGEPVDTTDTRTQILDAAGDVCARHGFAAATMDQIAERAGVGVATVYRTFGDKETLLSTFVEERTPRDAVRDVALHPSDDLRGDLQAIVGWSLPFFHEHRDIFRLLLLGSVAERQYLEHLRGSSGTTLDKLTAYFEAQQAAKRLGPSDDPRDLTLALVGLILSFTLIGPREFGTGLSDPDATAAFIVRVFLDGIQPAARETGVKE